MGHRVHALRLIKSEPRSPGSGRSHPNPEPAPQLSIVVGGGRVVNTGPILCLASRRYTGHDISLWIEEATVSVVNCTFNDRPNTTGSSQAWSERYNAGVQ